MAHTETINNDELAKVIILTLSPKSEKYPGTKLVVGYIDSNFEEQKWQFLSLAHRVEQDLEYDGDQKRFRQELAMLEEEYMCILLQDYIIDGIRQPAYQFYDDDKIYCEHYEKDEPSEFFGMTGYMLKDGILQSGYKFDRDQNENIELEHYELLMTTVKMKYNENAEAAIEAKGFEVRPVAVLEVPQP